jgi:Trypsin-co-occurring domain 2
VADEATQGTHSRSDAIDALRAELSKPMARARDQEIQFPVGEIQVEFQIGVTREAEGKAGDRTPVCVPRPAGGAHSGDGDVRRQLRSRGPESRSWLTTGRPSRQPRRWSCYARIARRSLPGAAPAVVVARPAPRFTPKALVVHQGAA